MANLESFDWIYREICFKRGGGSTETAQGDCFHESAGWLSAGGVSKVTFSAVGAISLSSVAVLLCTASARADFVFIRDLQIAWPCFNLPFVKCSFCLLPRYTCTERGAFFIIDVLSINLCVHRLALSLENTTLPISKLCILTSRLPPKRCC